jgi:hypothetical protein
MAPVFSGGDYAEGAAKRAIADTAASKLILRGLAGCYESLSS